MCIKRSALDRKPAARNLSMVSGGRRTPAWSYRNDDSRRDSPVSAGDDFKENSPASARGDVQNDVQDLDFSATLKKHGLEIREQEGDGNCLFRAISLQVYGDSSMHSDVRKQCMDFMVSTHVNHIYILSRNWGSKLTFPQRNTGPRQRTLFAVCNR